MTMKEGKIGALLDGFRGEIKWLTECGCCSIKWEMTRGRGEMIIYDADRPNIIRGSITTSHIDGFHKRQITRLAPLLDSEPMHQRMWTGREPAAAPGSP